MNAAWPVIESGMANPRLGVTKSNWSKAHSDHNACCTSEFSTPGTRSGLRAT